MAKKYTIKDIAALAGVSAGTVDRVLHNRGDVSLKSKRIVERVLSDINYIPKAAVQVPIIDKEYKILIILPQDISGNYWYLIAQGIYEALADFANIKLTPVFLHYDQLNLYSCREVFNKALKMEAHGVIIGPSFYDETVLFANKLFMSNIPYVFIDAAVNNTKPLAFFGPHASQTGVVQAKLLTSVLGENEDIAIFQAKRIGDESSIQSVARLYSFISYVNEHYPSINVHTVNYDNADKDKSWKLLDAFFSKNTNIGGGVVFDTRAHLIANYLKAHKKKQIKLIGYGTDQQNIHHLKDGYISFIISERPIHQGVKAIRTILDYLLYERKPAKIENYTPIDIIIKETIDFYDM